MADKTRDDGPEKGRGDPGLGDDFAQGETLPTTPWRDEPAPGAGGADETASSPPAPGADPPRRPPSADRSAGGTSDRIGPYRLLKELGRGGQGIVWLAEDIRLHRRVALKVISPQFAPAGSTLARFHREASAASRIDHPGICAIYEAGEADGFHYIAMRYVEGRALSELVEAARLGSASHIVPVQGGAETALTIAEDAARPEKAAAERKARAGSTPTSGRTPSTRDEIFRIIQLIERTARALHVAHEAGLIHRDIKPGNILVTPQGEPVILDFGLAREEEDGNRGLTVSGDLLGTPAYMSPEQVAAHRIALDRRTDIYSLGVTLYESLTLQRPFDAPTRDGVYQRILAGNPVSPSRLNRHISRDLEVVVATAIEKDRDRRYKTALDFAEDLRRVRTFEPIHARPAGPVLRTRRWVQRNPVLATAIVLLSLGLAVTLVLLDRARSEKKRADRYALNLKDANAELTSALAGRDEALSAQREALERVSRESKLKEDALDAERAANALAEAKSRETEDVNVRLEAALAEIAAERDRAQSLYLVGQAASVLDSNPAQAILLASEAAAQNPGRLANDVLLSALSRHYERRVLAAPMGAIAAFALDRSSERLATVTEQGEVNVWDVAAGRRELALPHPRGFLLVGVEFSPAGDRLLTPGSDGRAFVWSMPEGTLRLILEGHREGVALSSASFDPTGARIATTSRDGTARVWDANDGREITVLSGHGTGVAKAVFSPDGRRIVICSDGTEWEFHFDNQGRPIGHSAMSSRRSTASLSDAMTGEEIRLFEEHYGPVTAAWSSDGKRLVVGSRSSVRIHAAEDGKELAMLPPEGGGAPFGLGFLPGQLVWLQSEGGGALAVRSWRNGERVQKLDDIGSSAAAAVSAEPDLVVAPLRTDTRRVGVWNLTTGRLIRTLAGHESPVTTVAILPGGEACATGSKDGTVRIWSLGPSPVGHFLRPDMLGNVQDLMASRNGERLVLTRPGDAQVVSCSTGDVVSTLERASKSNWLPFHLDPVTLARWTPDGGVLGVLASGRLSSWTEAEERGLVEKIASVPTSLAISEDGSSVAFNDVQEDPAGVVQILRRKGGEWEKEASWTPSRGVASDLFLAQGGEKVVAVAMGSPLTIVEYRIEMGEESLVAEIPFLRAERGAGNLQTSADPDCRLLALIGSGRRLAVVDLRSRALFDPFEKPLGDEPWAEVERDGRRVLVVSEGGMAILELSEDGLDLRTTVNVPREGVPGRTSQERRIRRASFVPGHELLAAIRANGTVELFDSRTGVSVREIGRELGPIYGVDFDSDGSRFVAVGPTRHARVFNTEDGALLIDLAHSEPVHLASFSPNGEKLLTVARDGRLRVWNASTGERLSELSRSRFGDEVTYFYGSRFRPSSDGHRVVEWSYGLPDLRVWDADTGKILCELERAGRGDGDPIAIAPEAETLALAIALGLPSDWSRFAPVLPSFLSAPGRAFLHTRESILALVNGLTGEPIRVFSGLDSTPRAIVLSPGGERVAMASWSRFGVWDTTTGEVLLLRDDFDTFPIAFTPDGTYLLAFATRPGAARSPVRIDIEANTLAVLGEGEGEGDAASAALAPDGAIVAVWSTDGTVRLRELMTGGLVGTLRGHSGAITTAVFSDESRWLATASDDRTVRVWDVSGRREWLTIPHPTAVTGLAFCGGENALMTWTALGTSDVWKWPLDPLAEARGAISRRLTSAERERFQIGSESERRAIQRKEHAESLCERLRVAIRTYEANPSDVESIATALEREAGAVRTELDRAREANASAADAAVDSECLRDVLESTSADRRILVELRADIEALEGDLSTAILLLEGIGDESELPGWIRSKLETYREAALPDLPTFRSIDDALLQIDTIIPPRATWKFFRGLSDPSPDIEWTRVDFDDSDWEEGPSGFGYGDGDDATVLDDMHGRYTTIYVRHVFQLDDPGRYRSFRLQLAVDDGAVAWVNGVEVGRSRVSPLLERISHTEKAASIASDPAEDVSFDIPLSLLRAGPNVVAIQGLNQAIDSSDLSLIPALAAVPVFDPERGRARFEEFRNSARGLDAPLRIAYLEARLLEHAGRNEEAYRLLLDIARSAPGRPEVVVALARTERAIGRPREALARLSGALQSGAIRSRSAWDLWLELLFRDSGGSFADAIQFLGNVPAARLPETFLPVRDTIGELAEFGAIRVACGHREEVTDQAGNRWSADRFFSGGQIGGRADDTRDILKTDDDELYRHERYFPPALRPEGYGYHIPVPPGSYLVDLLFAEIYYEAAGERVFDVLIEGAPVLQSYDPFRDGGGFFSGDRRSFTVDVEDTVLDIRFVARTEYPKIAAIEVRPAAE